MNRLRGVCCARNPSIVSVQMSEFMIAHVVNQLILLIGQTVFVYIFALLVFKISFHGSLALAVLITLLQGLCGMSLDPSTTADIHDAFPVMRSVRVTVQRLNFANFLREEIARAETEMQNGEKNDLKALKVVFDILDDRRQRDVSVHQRYERHWLGGFKIPFRVVCMWSKKQMNSNLT
ncbi:hypothetical protein DAPPUDRAFT_265490 [Daphnia pulex]|uniref:Uncharacterized protein n=1 Tax=Daphnia pulex TaxID=6669 RepID=E9HTJ3_DAPPU|nr:hypothetical protein DAPPUDRAFT_265490 [Daphnia pulex]|eukprot:EFX64935.1 hypothetical protein DAPPUDRAFT_265490 [Daphnia pulex]